MWIPTAIAWILPLLFDAPGLPLLPPTPGTVLFAPAKPLAACVDGLPDPPAAAASAVPLALNPLRPVPIRNYGEHKSVDWKGVETGSLRLLAVMQAFRWATEPGTRAGGTGLGKGYLRAVSSLHGWSDGDPFYVNYVGHPMQGAVAGRLFGLNDHRYNRAEFGRSRQYWKGKLRATAFAWAFSEQFEIGPVSEASIGHIQSAPPQEGFVDHIVTPVMGFGWMVGEDAIDRYLIRRVEDATANRWLRLAARTGLNPARSFATLLSGQAPWHRDTRDGILQYRPEPTPAIPAASPPSAETAGPAPFEFTVTSGLRRIGGRDCIGGGADAAYRVAEDWQVALAVGGCKILGTEKAVSGDALVYQVGPRWTPNPEGKWSPYAHLLVGGMKVTYEQVTAKAALPLVDDASGFAISGGAGVDYRLNAALALRVANVEYQRASLPTLNGSTYNKGLQVSTGMVLRIGTW